MRMEPFFGSVFWGPTWIESCVMDAGSARVTGGTLMKIRCASCAPAARIQAPRARSIATTVPAVNLSPMDAIRLRSRVSFSKRQELTYQEGAVAVTAVNVIQLPGPASSTVTSPHAMSTVCRTSTRCTFIVVAASDAHDLRECSLS
jgi:hypothetical protein